MIAFMETPGGRAYRLLWDLDDDLQRIVDGRTDKEFLKFVLGEVRVIQDGLFGEDKMKQERNRRKEFLESMTKYAKEQGVIDDSGKPL